MCTELPLISVFSSYSRTHDTNNKDRRSKLVRMLVIKTAPAIQEVDTQNEMYGSMSADIRDKSTKG